MSGPFIAVVDYGIGNLRSAEKGSLQGRCRCPPGDLLGVRSARPTAWCCPGWAILAAAARLCRTAGCGAATLEAASSGRPFLGICVGMQLLYEGSEESPGVPGLSVFEGTVSLLPDRRQAPSNAMEPPRRAPGSRLLKGFEQNAWVYFVHSYAAPIGQETAATCDYGGPVAAAVETGPVWATQFHPEKSSSGGPWCVGQFRGCLQLEDGAFPGYRPESRALCALGPGRFRPGNRLWDRAR